MSSTVTDSHPSPMTGVGDGFGLFSGSPAKPSVKKVTARSFISYLANLSIRSPRLRQLRRLLPCAGLLWCAGAHLSAQTLVYPPIASFNQAWGAEISHSLPADISRGSTGLGEMDATHSRIGWLGTIRTAKNHSLLAGLEWRGSVFDSPAGAPIPDDLHSIALKLGSEWRMEEKWTLRFEADPGLYSDFEDINGDDFNTPLALRLTWSQSTNLTWVVGIGVD